MRWIGVALAIGFAAFALVTVVRGRDDVPRAPTESIDAASKAELERVLRDSGAGEATPP
jgi:hypothetical protein